MLEPSIQNAGHRPNGPFDAGLHLAEGEILETLCFHPRRGVGHAAHGLFAGRDLQHAIHYRGIGRLVVLLLVIAPAAPAIFKLPARADTSGKLIGPHLLVGLGLGGAMAQEQRRRGSHSRNPGRFHMHKNGWKKDGGSSNTPQPGGKGYSNICATGKNARPTFSVCWSKNSLLYTYSTMPGAHYLWLNVRATSKRSRT
jgi:hypothetical protein